MTATAGLLDLAAAFVRDAATLGAELDLGSPRVEAWETPAGTAVRVNPVSRFAARLVALEAADPTDPGLRRYRALPASEGAAELVFDCRVVVDPPLAPEIVDLGLVLVVGGGDPASPAEISGRVARVIPGPARADATRLTAAIVATEGALVDLVWGAGDAPEPPGGGSIAASGHLTGLVEPHDPSLTSADGAPLEVASPPRAGDEVGGP